MADIKHTILMAFEGEDKTGETMSGVSKGLGDMEGEAGKCGRAFKEMFSELPGIVGGAAAGVGTAIAGIAVAAVAAADEFANEQERMRGALGLTEEKAEAAAKVAQNIYSGTALTEGLSEATDAVIYAYQLMGNAGDTEVQNLTEKALLLAKTYDQDVNKSMDSAKTLMDTLGLSADEAFDFLAKGFQNGLDRSGDFLDTVGEYSTQFGDAGADAGQFFSLLETSIQGGILGTDKGADAFKEFTLKIREGSDDITAALANLKIDPSQFDTLSVIDKFNLVTQKIGEMDDPIAQFNAGIVLLGTPWEDMGTKAGIAIDTAKTKLSDITGAFKNLPTTTLTEDLTILFKTVLTEVATSDIWQNFRDAVKEELSNIKAVLPELDYKELLGSLEKLGSDISSVFKKIFGIENLGGAGDTKQIFQSVVDSLNLIVTAADKVVGLIGDIGGAVGDVSGFIGTLSSNPSEAWQSFLKMTSGGEMKTAGDDAALAFEAAKIKAQEMLSAVKDTPAEVEKIGTAYDQVAKGIDIEKFKIEAELDTQTFSDKISEVEGYIQNFVDGTRDTIPDDLLFLEIDAKVKDGAEGSLKDVQNILLDLNDFAFEEKALEMNLADQEVWDGIADVDAKIDAVTKLKREVELGVKPGGDDYVEVLEGRLDTLTKEKKEIMVGISASADIQEQISEIDKQISLLSEEEYLLKLDVTTPKEDIDAIALTIDSLISEKNELVIGLEQGGYGDTMKSLDELTKERQMYILANADKASIEGVNDFLIDTVGDHKIITYLPETDYSKLEIVSKAVESVAPDGTKTVRYVPIMDDGAADKVDEQLEAEEFQERLLQMVVELDDDQARIDIEKFKNDADKLKAFEIKAKLDTDMAKIEADKFKTQAELIQSSVEWKAKLDIAEVEANAEIIASTFDSIQTGMETTASLMSDLFKSLTSTNDFYDKILIEKAINQQLELQKKEFDLQERMTNEQIKLLEAKRKALESGEGFKIEVKADGLKPQLEMIWWDILESLQTMVNEEGGAMLLGI